MAGVCGVGHIANMEDIASKPRTPKFKHTREVVRFALEEMTQDEIARLCRVPQSTVSAWASGKARAREQVLKPLVARYGHRLNRTTSRLYLVQGEPTPPWAETPTGRLVTGLVDDPKAYTREQVPDDQWHALISRAVRRRPRPEYAVDKHGRRESPGGTALWFAADAPRDEHGDPTEDALIPITEDELAAAEGAFRFSESPPVLDAWMDLKQRTGLTGSEAHYAAYLTQFLKLVRVEGAPIWRHGLGRPTGVDRRHGRHGERKEVEMQPVERWIVHPAGAAMFRLVVQSVRTLTGGDAQAWASGTYGAHDTEDGRVRSEDDVARWVGTIFGPFDLPALLAAVEARLPGAGPHDRATVPFTLRKSLAERGYDVPGIEVLSD